MGLSQSQGQSSRVAHEWYDITPLRALAAYMFFLLFKNWKHFFLLYAENPPCSDLWTTPMPRAVHRAHKSAMRSTRIQCGCVPRNIWGGVPAVIAFSYPFSCLYPLYFFNASRLIDSHGKSMQEWKIDYAKQI
jgi:hypothetical protein